MHILTDIHSHKINSGDVRTIYNIRINEQSLTLPSGPNILFSAGIHPWDVGDIRSAWMENMEILLNFDHVVALGECGLDKNSSETIEQQIEIFEIQVKLAESYKKPMIIHCVGCFNELVSIHKVLNPKQPWIIHGFRGKPALAEQLTKAGFYLSFGEHFNPQSVKITPIERILVETDESEMEIEDIYKKLVALKQCRIENLNAVEFIFGF